MSRAEDRRKARKINKQNTVFEKLTPVEQQLLIDWTNERMSNTWQKVEENLIKVMRKNRISEKRTDKIFTEFREYTNKLFGGK